MAQRHTVYLRRSAAHVTAEQLLASIRAVEWDLVAEACGVPQERISEADEHMRIEAEGTGFSRYYLSYRPGDERAVQIDRPPTPDLAAGVIGEVIDNLDPGAPSSPKVREFLEVCVDTVSASYGSGRGEEPAPILASQVCLWLAQQLAGIVRDPRGDWYEPTGGLDFKPL